MKRAALMALATLLAGGGWLWLDFEQAMRRPLKLPHERLVFIVRPGMSAGGIAEELVRQGALENPWYFVLEAHRRGVAHRLKAGEYELASGTTVPEIVNRLAAGEVLQHRFTLIEGWTFAQVRAALEQEPALFHTLTWLSDAEVMARLGHPGEHPEGRFFPDTYYFPAGTTDLALLGRAYARMQAVLAALWAERDPSVDLSPYEALTVASIVEKETAVASERPLVAGVILRRLKQGMRLQVDPTVIYGMGGGFDGNLRKEDLRRDSQYNTYRRQGLPPTPIAMPSEASLRAVVHADRGEALYFVARGDGTHEFSSTLEQHNRAVARYQGRVRDRVGEPAGE